MRPTTAVKDNVFDINALIRPGTVFNHPRDVVSHPTLTFAEKRAILASWASDASAIASCPALRAPDGLKAPHFYSCRRARQLEKFPLRNKINLWRAGRREMQNVPVTGSYRR